MKKYMIYVFSMCIVLFSFCGCSNQEKQLEKAAEVIYAYQEAVNSYDAKKILSLTDEQDVMTYENPEMTLQEITSTIQRQFDTGYRIDNIVINSSRMLEGFEEIYKESKSQLLSHSNKQLENGIISQKKNDALKELLKPIDAAAVFNVTISGIGSVRDFAALKVETEAMEETMNLFVLYCDGKWVMDTDLMKKIPYWIDQKSANKVAAFLYKEVDSAFYDVKSAGCDMSMLKTENMFFVGADFEKAKITDKPKTENEIWETVLAKIYEKEPAWAATISHVGIKIKFDSKGFSGCKACAVQQEQGSTSLFGTYPNKIDEDKTFDNIEDALENKNMKQKSTDISSKAAK